MIRIIIASFLVWSAAAVPVEAAARRQINGLTVVYLKGSSREIGRQHGELLKQEVSASVGRILGYFRSYLKFPLIRTAAVNWWLDSAWGRARPFVPAAFTEELQGLAEGSGVPLSELRRLHAIPDRTYSCANFAAWGRATAGGRLIHLRNLDWNIKAGIQEHPVVFVIHPDNKRAFVNIGWAGFIGVLTGVNEEQISIGQIGAETVDATFRGEPMVSVMRRILEESGSVEEAVSIIQEARRTVGVNYVVSDAKKPSAVAIETTRRHVAVFRADDPVEHAVVYARPIADAVLRADMAVDPLIREKQTASDGNPHKPGLEDPSESSAYSTRYLGQAAGLLAHYGSLDAGKAQQIARAVAPDSNVQSVVFAWPDVWIANAQGSHPAAQRVYQRLNLTELFSQPTSSQ